MSVPTKENTIVLAGVDTGGKNTQKQNQISLSSPHSRSRDQPSIEGHPREERWSVTHSKGKDADS